jgi:hypothetical protein
LFDCRFFLNRTPLVASRLISSPSEGSSSIDEGGGAGRDFALP